MLAAGRWAFIFIMKMNQTQSQTYIYGSKTPAFVYWFAGVSRGANEFDLCKRKLDELDKLLFGMKQPYNNL